MYKDDERLDEVEKILKIIRKSYLRILKEYEIMYLPFDISKTFSAGKELYELISIYFPCSALLSSNKYNVIVVEDNFYDINGKINVNDFYRMYRNKHKGYNRMKIPTFIIDEIKKDIEKELNKKNSKIKVIKKASS